MVNADRSIEAILGEARARSGRTLADIAAELRIRERYLEALESGDRTVLPPPAFAAGFVRSYADMLGLDGGALARRFREEAGCVETGASLHFPEPVAESRLPGRASMMTAAVGVLAIYFGWFADFTASGANTAADARAVDPVPERLAVYAPADAPAGAAPADMTVHEIAVSEEEPAAPAVLVADDTALAPFATAQAVETTVARPEPARKLETSPAPDAAAAPQRIVLTATDDAWLRVVDAMDREIWNGVLHAGESWSPARPGLRMMTSNAGAVTLAVDGRRLGALGDGGAVVRDIRLDPDLLAAVDRHVIN